MKLTRLIKLKFNSFKSRIHGDTNLIFYGSDRSGKTECVLREARKHGDKILIVSDILRDADMLKMKLQGMNVYTAARPYLDKCRGISFETVLIDNARCMDSVYASLIGIIFQRVIITMESGVKIINHNNFKTIRFI